MFKSTWRWRARVFQRALEASSRKRAEMGRELQALRKELQRLQRKVVANG